MDQRPLLAVRLDYQRANPKARRPRLRLGILSVLLSAFSATGVLAVALATNHLRLSPFQIDACLNAMEWVSLGGLGLGIGGMFQKGARRSSILGITLSILGLILLAPTFVVA